MTNVFPFVLLTTVQAATLVCVTDWLFRSILELPTKRPLHAAAATVLLSFLTVGPAVLGVDALVGVGLSSLSRALLWLAVGVVQTGLVLRLIFSGSLALSFANGLILQLTWGALAVLVLLCDQLGGLYCAAPLALFLSIHIARSTQERELVRRLSSVPPAAPNHGLQKAAA